MTSSPPPMSPRVGIGDDTHRLGKGGPLRIGGIDVQGDHHAIGHSDADVLLHAVVDALMGAIAGPDIGRLFPDDREENAGRDSRDFVAEAVRRVEASGHRIANVDAVVLLQRPKLAGCIDEMRQAIAEMLAVPISSVGLKAKTGESLGEIGRSEAVQARVVAMLVPVAA